uniref:Uncharacterized protein n=1 Tax=viral metagenome TaxID=1070528 RepID=A0A6H2A2P3_9ZZZZ
MKRIIIKIGSDQFLLPKSAHVTTGEALDFLSDLVRVSETYSSTGPKFKLKETDIEFRMIDEADLKLIKLPDVFVPMAADVEEV